jgi:lysophospholipase L1-like esterase
MGRTVFCRAFLAAASAFLMAGCGLLGPSRFIREADYTETIRVACVGDSITYGRTIQNRWKNSYPRQLGDLLGERWDVRNFGVTSATILKKGDNPYWKESAFDLAQKFEPHVVIINLGTNDTKPQNWRYAEGFVDDYVEMIRTFTELESHPLIWICYPVPAYRERWGIRDSIIRQKVLAKIDQIAAETGCPIIDLYTALSGRPELFSDEIHPNAAGARAMAGTVYTAMTGRRSAAPSSHEAASLGRIRIPEMNASLGRSERVQARL